LIKVNGQTHAPALSSRCPLDRGLVRYDNRSECCEQETISCPRYISNTHSAGVQSVAQRLNRSSLKVKLSELTSLPCVNLPFLNVRFSCFSNCIILIQIICNSLRCLPNITNVTTLKNGVLEGIVIEYTPTRVPWAEIKRVSSLLMNYISFASMQYLNEQPVTLHGQNVRPYK
jgi:hypothetical protein